LIGATVGFCAAAAAAAGAVDCGFWLDCSIEQAVSSDARNMMLSNGKIDDFFIFLSSNFVAIITIQRLLALFNMEFVQSGQIIVVFKQDQLASIDPICHANKHPIGHTGN
jgi:hypothetical protein